MVTAPRATETSVDIDVHQRADEFVQRWLTAWNSHEPERVLELMTDDILFDDSARSQTMRGPTEVREFLALLWRAFPDFRVTPPRSRPRRTVRPGPSTRIARSSRSDPAPRPRRRDGES